MITASRRKSVVHLEKMKDLDFLDLVEQLQCKNSKRYLLNNVEMTVKVDGVGGRFGKDSAGAPFFESSNSGPIQHSNAFTSYARTHNITDQIRLDRAKHYDELYEQILKTIAEIDKKVGASFLKNVKVHCEILYKPMAVEEDHKLKFVNLRYNQFPSDIELALVPLFVETADTKEEHPIGPAIKKQLITLGRLGSAIFIDNSLKKEKELDVTNIIRPIANISNLRDIVSSKQRSEKKKAKDIIQPVKEQLAKEIINSPGILGKTKLGDEYEGIILYSKNGPIKVTTDKFKNIISKPTKKSCIVTGGSLVGHRGHMHLIDTLLRLAKEQNRTPFVYISSTVGDDDPIPPDVKLSTWKKLYPNNQEMFQLVISGGSIVKKIEKELVFDAGFKDVLVVVGDDRKDSFDVWLDNLRNRLANPKFPQNQDVVLSAHSRQEFGSAIEGTRFTQLRNAVKNANLSNAEQLAQWVDGFDKDKLGVEWIKYLIEIIRKHYAVKKKQSK